VADIAHELDIGFKDVWQVVQQLQEKGLVSLSRKPSPTAPARP
jgi:biotin operon repressor